MYCCCHCTAAATVLLLPLYCCCHCTAVTVVLLLYCQCPAVLLLLYCYHSCRCCIDQNLICQDYNDPTKQVCCKTACLPHDLMDIRICCPRELLITDAAGAAVACCPKDRVYGDPAKPSCCEESKYMCTAADGTRTCCPWPCNQDGSCCEPPLVPCPSNPLVTPVTCCEGGFGCIKDQ
jgi:hypothetical protein